MTDEEARRQRLADNERLVRESNWEEALLAGEGPADEELEFWCACGRPDCRDRLYLTVGEYRAAHSRPHRFIVAHGHADPDVERVVVHDRQYDIVEKLPAYQGVDPTYP